MLLMASFFHLDLKYGIPSSHTYLKPTYQISKAQYWRIFQLIIVLIFSSNLTLGNPNISIFFDQLGFLLNTQHNTKRNKQPIDWKNNKFLLF